MPKEIQTPRELLEEISSVKSPNYSTLRINKSEFLSLRYEFVIFQKSDVDASSVAARGYDEKSASTEIKKFDAETLLTDYAKTVLSPEYKISFQPSESLEKPQTLVGNAVSSGVSPTHSRSSSIASLN